MTTGATRLVQWYQDERRDLPWRRTNNPYAIWVSETMLQQTRVETVIPYYFAFLERFPTICALATANFEEIAKLWQGLGYYSRARNLHRAAIAVTDLYGGEVPNDFDVFRSLPGVGPYTAGAVFSIAFNQPMPAVDGNVLRVMSRYLGITDVIDTAPVKRMITEQVGSWLQLTRPTDLTQALMELGATICTPKRPNCSVCPLQEDCVAFRDDLTSEVPVRKPKTAKRKVIVYAYWMESEGRVLMQRRPEDGLLAGMWQLPAIEINPPEALSESVLRKGLEQLAENLFSEEATSDTAAFANELAAGLTAGEGAGLTAGASAAAETQLGYSDRRMDERSFVQIAEMKHVFTHIEWLVKVMRPISPSVNPIAQVDAVSPVSVVLNTVSAAMTPAGNSAYRWVPFSEVHELVLPRVYEKLLTQILQQGV